MTGIEPVTSSLPRKCSTSELHRQNRAEDGAQTRDPQLGRLMLYRLSYFRELTEKEDFTNFTADSTLEKGRNGCKFRHYF